MAKHFNISGELTQELLAAGDNTSVSNKDVFNFIKDNLKFDVLIWEFGDESPNWVHCSYVEGLNRGQVYRNSKENGLEMYSEKKFYPKKEWVITDKPNKNEQKKKKVQGNKTGKLSNGEVGGVSESSRNNT